MRRVHLLFVLTIAFVAFQHRGDAQFCSQHMFLGDNPYEGNPGWHEEAQGLAHDADNWYMTQNSIFFSPPAGPLMGGPQLWRIPVTHDLGDGVDCSNTEVSCKRLLETPLFANGYNHYGDPDFYQFGDRGYLLIPIEGGDAGPAVAVFRADATLEFVAFALVPGLSKIGWLAVDPDGLLVTSDGGLVREFKRFSVNWVLLGDDVLSIDPLDSPVVLHDEAGLPLELDGPQGGEFSDDGQLLYFSNGFIGDMHPSWGVHVFRTRPGSGSECGGAATCVAARRIERSNNSPGGFAFEFDPSDDVLDPILEEPEGLTAWDLDADGRAPGLRGQLHVVLLDNDIASADDVYVKHYRVSFDDSVAPEISCPVDTVAECSAPAGVPGGDPQLSSFFAGASATDACDEQPAIGNNAPAFFNLGTTPVTFTATDDALNASSCQARAIVVDTTAPAIACRPATTVECTGGGGVSAGDPQLAPFFQGVSASDVCDATASISNDAPGSLPLGQTMVTFTAGDDAGNASSCGSTVTVADTVAPQISVVLSQGTLWPPNHKLVPITATVGVMDRCDPSVSFQLVSITSSEPDDGLGDGDTSGDIQGADLGTADTTFLFRVERSGNRNGRTYTIVYRAADSTGNAGTATAYVRVPHHR